ncbi:hypothetical protein D9C01_12775, partial [Corynebacterium diphtheriae]
AVTTAITVAILLIIALHLKRFEDLKQAMYEGTPPVHAPDLLGGLGRSATAPSSPRWPRSR